jgi:hypothetical protein
MHEYAQSIESMFNNRYQNLEVRVNIEICECPETPEHYVPMLKRR